MRDEKYIRQIVLPQLGASGQQKLYNAKVLIVGAGGLGNVILPYLASSGVGTIGIIDGDTIALSNLHRQILFTESEIGKSKVAIISKKLKYQFPETKIVSFNEYLSVDNALSIFKEFDIIVDATDHIDIRYLINDACVITNKPFVHASIYRFQFQIATFNVKQSGTYRCLYTNPSRNTKDCKEAGVMPTTVALAGMYQANEVIKLIIKTGKLFTNQLVLVDTLYNKQHTFSYKTKKHEFINELFFNAEYQKKEIQKISYSEALQSEGVFLDVRQLTEQPVILLENLIQIPLQRLEDNLSQLPKDRPIYIFCQSGIRSSTAFQLLQQAHFDKIFCLEENALEINTYEFIT